MIFEYKMRLLPIAYSGTDQEVQMLNDFGAAGWELVSAVYVPNKIVVVIFYFKRALP